MASYRSVSEFDDEELSLERKRKMIAAMMAQDAPSRAPQGRFYTPDYGALHKAIGDAAGTYDLERLNEQSRDLASKRADFARQALEEYPMPREASPEIEGTGPIAPPPGAPGVEQAPPPAPAGEADVMEMPSANNMTPDTPAGWVGPDNALSMLPQGVTEFKANKAAEPGFLPTIQDQAKWGIKYAGLSPFHANLATEGYKRALDQPEKARLVAEAIQAKKDAAVAAAAQRVHEKEIAHINADALREKKGIDAVNLQEVRDANRYALEEAKAAYREALKAAGGTAPKTQTTTLVDIDGTPLEYHPSEQDPMKRFTRMGTDDPPKGTPESRSGAEKGAKIVRNATGAIERGQTALDMLEATPGAFGGWKAAGAAASSILPDAAESAIRENYIYSPEEMETQAYIGREGAQILHDLYGAAVTRGEGGRAKPFEYKSGDTPGMIASKIRSMMKIMQSKAEEQSPAAKAVANPAGAPKSSGLLEDIYKKYKKSPPAGVK
jgi:hypothetical protein